jgi:hypothetical protein
VGFIRRWGAISMITVFFLWSSLPVYQPWREFWTFRLFA